MIFDSEMSALTVKNMRSSSLVTENDRFPIQIPYLARFPSVSASLDSGLLDLLDLGFSSSLASPFLFFFALRSAFFETGSGAEISISSSGPSCSLRFF